MDSGAWARPRCSTTWGGCCPRASSLCPPTCRRLPPRRLTPPARPMPLRVDEARRLIEHPVAEMPLRYRPEAVDRVLSLTSGHPFLIQLLCSELVHLKNEQAPAERRLATLGDVEEAVGAALEHGTFFF